ncbi:hypothetical protein PN36_35230, partial [Candidatus Thiomargarita nelsonii]
EIKQGEFKKGEEKGFNDGYGEGKEDGIKKGKIETARNFKANGVLTAEQIASATGLSLDEVMALL